MRFKGTGKFFVLTLVTVLSVFQLSACGGGGGGGNSSSSDNGGSIRFVNGVSDSTRLSMAISDSVVSTISFGTTSDELEYIPGNKEITFYAVDSSGDSEELDLSVDVKLLDDHEVLVAVYGTLDNPQLQVVDVEEFDENDDYGQIGLLMLSANQPALDMYLSADETGIYGNDPLFSNAELGQFYGMQVVDEDEYRLQFTQVGSKDSIYDGGYLDIVEDRNHFIIVFDNFGATGGSMVAVEVAGSSSALELISDDSPSLIRFLNGIADYPSVDVYLGDTEGDPIFEDISFGQETAYSSLEAGAYSVNVTPHTVKDTFLLEKDLTLISGELSTLVASGLTLDEDTGVSGALINDTVRNEITEAHLTFVHASPSNEEVDIYILVPGQPITDTSPVISELDYLLSFDYEKAPGKYEIMVMQSSNEATVLGPISITLSAGDNLDLYLLDNNGGGTPGTLEVYEL